MPKYNILVDSSKDIVMLDKQLPGNKYNPILIESENTILNVKYGALYNWFAAVDPRGIASAGWRVPTDDDFFNGIGSVTLFIQVDPEDPESIMPMSGGIMKDLVTWQPPNTGAYPGLNFNATATGQRYQYGSFGDMGYTTIFITTNYSPGHLRGGYSLSYSSASCTYTSLYVGDGAPIRLRKNTTTLSNGQYGTYTGNDGKIYSTICIEGVEWLTGNLCETKYSNGDSIPIVTSDSEWANLFYDDINNDPIGTGAMCYYNNNINNAYVI